MSTIPEFILRQLARECSANVTFTDGVETESKKLTVENLLQFLALSQDNKFNISKVEITFISKESEK